MIDALEMLRKPGAIKYRVAVKTMTPERARSFVSSLMPGLTDEELAWMTEKAGTEIRSLRTTDSMDRDKRIFCVGAYELGTSYTLLGRLFGVSKQTIYQKVARATNRLVTGTLPRTATITAGDPSSYEFIARAWDEFRSMSERVPGWTDQMRPADAVDVAFSLANAAMQLDTSLNPAEAAMLAGNEVRENIVVTEPESDEEDLSPADQALLGIAVPPVEHSTEEN